MKTYPSIPGPSAAPLGADCISFFKYDGSNIRAEWNKKQGWYKFGTRRRLFDEKDPEYGPAIPNFYQSHAEGLEKVFTDNKNYRGIKQAIVYFEYYGPSSFGCFHDFSEPFKLTIIDVGILTKGFVLPNQFVKDFGHLDSAQVVYQGPLNQQFIQDVINNKFNLKEGVVAKGTLPCRGMAIHGLFQIKIKTNWWMTELRKRAQESIEFKRLLAENELEQATLQA